MPPSMPPGQIPLKDYAAKAVELSLDHDQHYVDENHAPLKAAVRWEPPFTTSTFVGIDITCRCGRPSFWSAREILRRWDSTREVMRWNPLIAQGLPEYTVKVKEE